MAADFIPPEHEVEQMRRWIQGAPHRPRCPLYRGRRADGHTCNCGRDQLLGLEPGDEPGTVRRAHPPGHVTGARA